MRFDAGIIATVDDLGKGCLRSCAISRVSHVANRKAGAPGGARSGQGVRAPSFSGLQWWSSVFLGRWSNFALYFESRKFFRLRARYVVQFGNHANVKETHDRSSEIAHNWERGRPRRHDARFMRAWERSIEKRERRRPSKRTRCPRSQFSGLT